MRPFSVRHEAYSGLDFLQISCDVKTGWTWMDPKYHNKHKYVSSESNEIVKMCSLYSLLKAMSLILILPMFFD